VVAAGVGLVVGGVVALELVPLEAGGDPVGGGDDPLQEAVGLVVHGGRVDEGVGDVDARAAGEGCMSPRTRSGAWASMRSNISAVQAAWRWLW
jgi:hypothetical protein